MSRLNDWHDHLLHEQRAEEADKRRAGLPPCVAVADDFELVRDENGVFDLVLPGEVKRRIAG